MPTAYTPGLTIAADTWVRKERLLPLPGEVLVSEGEQVEADTPVARAMRPGNLTTVKVSERLGIGPSELPAAMIKSEGDAVAAGEVIAETRALFGLMHNAATAPVAGTVEHISPLSGYVSIREQPAPLETLAHISGRVARVIAGMGAEIETRAALIQGIFGVGGQRRGVLRLAARGPDQPLQVGLVGGEARGAVLVGGATADARSLAEAARSGATGVVVGGIADVDLHTFVGYDIGVAVTGQEQVPFTLIITEGFGRVSMAQVTFDLLASLAGKQASIDGATQIRAGVMRPEVIVPLGATSGGEAPPAARRLEAAGQLALGAQVRLIREPHFGRLAVVTALPPQPQEIETEARVRVVEVDLGDGRKVLVPRANVEMVHG